MEKTEIINSFYTQNSPLEFDSRQITIYLPKRKHTALGVFSFCV